jgi:gluconate kinase
MPLVKVDNATMVRDTSSMALMNTDESARNDYYMKSKLLSTQKQEINKVKSEIETIKNDVSEIKNLMLKLLDKGSNV